MESMNEHYHISILALKKDQARLEAAREVFRVMGLQSEQISEIEKLASRLASRTVEDSRDVYWRVLSEITTQACGKCLDLPKIEQAEHDRADIQAMKFRR